MLAASLQGSGVAGQTPAGAVATQPAVTASAAASPSPGQESSTPGVLDATGNGGKAVGATGLVQELPDEPGESCMVYTTMNGERAILSFVSRAQINATDQPGPGTNLVYHSVAAAEGQ